MPKSSSGFNPAEYATVAERLALFHAAYPFGRVETRLHSRDARQVTFVAEVYRHADDARPAATGWASEREGDGEVNAVACLENTETSAIGRALANLGFAASRRRASLEEMLGAARRAGHGRLRLVRERPPSAEVAGDAPAAATDAARDANAAFDALQAAADALADALGQLAQAERLGMPARDVARLRRALGGRSVPPSAIARAEREVRAWFEEHVPAPPVAPPPAPSRPPTA